MGTMGTLLNGSYWADRLQKPAFCLVTTSAASDFQPWGWEAWRHLCVAPQFWRTIAALTQELGETGAYPAVTARYYLKRKSRRDRLRTKIQQMKEELRRRMHRAISEQGGG
jgi:hypothetical protein